MDRQITLQRYRAMDLSAFALMLSISEAVIVTAATRWFPDQLYTVSVTAAVVSIVLMRWGAAAAIHAVLGGAVFCAAAHAEPGQYLIYCAGNLFSLASLLWLRLLGKERIRNDGFLSVTFALCTLLFMQLGRAAAALVLGAAASACLGFVTTDLLSGLFTALIVWIARRLDGIFEDQKHYLLRIHERDTWGEEREGTK
ncbi:MAG: hypothetical protein E7425_03515 [Ruminococcaceae bacterium]|nr:hypothetical protein [Oscillospiraceae bacterium]